MFTRANTAHNMEAELTTSFLRFSDLVERGIVNNRTTLYRWIRDNGFPAPIALGPNTKVWHPAQVEQYITERERASRTAAE